MADHNPTPWPPAPTESSEHAAKPPSKNDIAGWVSLGMALIGILSLALPVMLARLSGYVPELPSGAAYLVWWPATLVLGIIGRRSLAGKIGIAITLIVLCLIAIVLILLSKHPVGPP